MPDKSRSTRTSCFASKSLHVKRDAQPKRYTREQVIDQQAGYYRCARAEIEQLAHPSVESYQVLEGRAVGWLLMLGRYLSLHESGAEISAVRYEDVQGRRDATLRKVLASLGLPETALPSMLRAFETDAQAGTKLARDAGRGNTLKLPEDQQATVRKLLTKQPLLNSGDVVLPGTIRIEGYSR